MKKLIIQGMLPTIQFRIFYFTTSYLNIKMHKTIILLAWSGRETWTLILK